VRYVRANADRNRAKPKRTEDFSIGPLNPEIRERLGRLPAERLGESADAVLDAKSLKELGLED
jgi:hypothetical protein